MDIGETGKNQKEDQKKDENDKTTARISKTKQKYKQTELKRENDTNRDKYRQIDR